MYCNVMAVWRRPSRSGLFWSNVYSACAQTAISRLPVKIILSIYNNIYEILGEYNHLHPTSNFGGPSSCPPPLNFPVMPAGLPVEVIAKVPSRYYRVPRYFFTVLTVAHNRWYRPTLLRCAANATSRVWHGAVQCAFLHDSGCPINWTRAIDRVIH